jgi:hypothetical protein
LENHNLVNYASAAMDFVKKDEFSPGFNETPLVGRHFKVTVPYAKDETSLNYRYDADKQSLSVWLYPESNLHFDKQAYPQLNYLILQKESTVAEPVPMSNAYGVTRDVRRVHHRIFGLGGPKDLYMGVVQKDQYSSKDFVIYKMLSKDVPLSPDAARAGVEGLAMDIEGVIVKPSGRHTINCTNETTDAKLDYAYEDTWDECVISVKLTRIVVYSPSLGVIADWQGQAAQGKPKAHNKNNA